MSPAPLEELAGALDGHIRLMRELVEVAQREQAHLLAFETSQLAACAQEKLALGEQVGAHEVRCRQLLAEAASAMGAETTEELTVRALCLQLPAGERDALLTRVDCIKALAASLRELQGMTLVQARRGSELVRTWMNLLTRGDSAPDAETGCYTASGRRRPDPLPGGTVSTNA